MRRLLLSIFWLLNIGSVIQLAVIVISLWAVHTGLHSFSSLDVNVFMTEMVPWLTRLRNILISIFGGVGRWILALPVLFVAPMKLFGGTLIGFWIYSTLKNMPAGSANI